MLKIIITAVASLAVSWSVLSDFRAVGNAPFRSYARLSDYRFFKGKPDAMLPADGVLPYEVNAPLFSDRALKARYIVIPKDSAANYHADGVFRFPIGTVLIKNFYYKNTVAATNANNRLLETRLIVNETDGWHAYPYHWNAAQTEAYLELAGDDFWVDIAPDAPKTKPEKLHYFAPNLNQCKGCHNTNSRTMQPIGLTAAQLNTTIIQGNDTVNQLAHWQKLGILKHLPTAEPPKIPDYNDKKNTIDSRARAYLDANCAHCHNPEGYANTTGLMLNYTENLPNRYGVQKTPVAAGRGSGGLHYDIVAGKPEQSILYYRLASADAGVMMPELGRHIVDKKGLALIHRWIKTMRVGD